MIGIIGIVVIIDEIPARHQPVGELRMGTVDAGIEHSHNHARAAPGSRVVLLGAGFIGCNLTRFLLAKGHQVVVLDNFSTGKRENLAGLEQLVIFGLAVLGRLGLLLFGQFLLTLFHLVIL